MKPGAILRGGLFALVLVAHTHAAPPDRPNIVLVVVDDMGWTDAGCYGSIYHHTPRIDALAASGMRFTQAYAAGCVCSPTRAAIITGKYPARLHLTDYIPGGPAPADTHLRMPEWQRFLAPNEITVAEALKARGYATAHFGKWHLGGGDSLPDRQGFDVAIAAASASGRPASYFWPYGESDDPDHVPGLAALGGGPGTHLDDQITGEAIAFIEANKDGPFFLNVWHYAVHEPIEAPAKLVAEAEKRTPANGQANPVYSAMLSSVDRNIGRIVDVLDSLDLSRRTLIVVTSDNGGASHIGNPPATSNEPLRAGKGTAYEGGIRIPMIAAFPDVIPPASVSDVPVLSTDLYPTFCEMAGADASTASDGISLVSLLRAASEVAPRDLFWHFPHYRRTEGPWSAVRSGDWTLIRFHEGAREVLYHLTRDPSESNDASAVQPEITRRLGARLDAWLASVNAQLPEKQ